MRQLGRRLVTGLVGGVAGLLAMDFVGRKLAPVVRQRAPRPTDVFATARSMSPLGPHHEPGESATAAIGRIAYQKLLHRSPPEKVRTTLSYAVHVGYGLLVAAGYGLAAARSKRPLRAGSLFGLALWLFGDELAVPLLGLADKPTAYHPTFHLQSLAQHLGFGVATAAAAHVME